MSSGFCDEVLEMATVEGNENKAIAKAMAVLAEHDPDLLSNAPGMTEDAINDLIAEIAKNDVKLREDEKNDQHLNELKQQIKDARDDTYTIPKKTNKARIEFLRDVLVGRGKAE